MTLTKKPPLVQPRTNKKMIEQVYFILDSNIQRIEFEAQTCYKSSCEKNKRKVSISGDKSASDTILQNFEYMLQYIDALDRKIKLLQILRSWLRESNMLLVLDLLTNNKYLEFSEEMLEALVKDKNHSRELISA